MNRRLIEYDLPLAEISEESAREKNIRHGHPSTLHIWWARRPLASSRATAFAALIDDPGEQHPVEREQLLELVKRITPWEAVKGGNSADIEEARRLIREQFGYAPRVLDPFSGGGSIPLEALRLGCETYANDYNPVAVFIEKATLEWPQKFGIEVELPREMVEGAGDVPAQLSFDSADETVKVNLLAYLVEKWANIILEEARAEIGHFYPQESGFGLVGKRPITELEGWIPVGYLWARTIPCQNPTCGAEIPLVKQFWLCKKKGKMIAYRPIVKDNQVTFELLENEREIKAAKFNPSKGTVTRADAHCLVCGQLTKAKETRRLACEGQMGERMVAVVLHHPKQTGKKYRLATLMDEHLFAQAAAHLQEKLDNWPYLESPLPDEEMADDPRNLWVRGYGFIQFQSLFNTRQKLALVTFLEKIKGSYDRIQRDETRLLAKLPAVSMVDVNELTRGLMGYLGIIFSRQVDRNSKIARLDVTRESFQGTFVRQALPMTWDYAEISPFSGSSGDWSSNRNWVARYIKANQLFGDFNSQTSNCSATRLPFSDNYFDAVLTDPPYYDNVPYAALSDFFYVWLKRSIGEFFPELFATPLVPKVGEAIMEPTRHESKDEAKTFFEETLGAAFREIHRILKPGGIGVIVYAHKTTEGWETMLTGLVEAGLVVTSSWPLHTEMKTRLRAAQSAALASSIYMVCRKMEREDLGFWNEIQPTIRARVQEKLKQFWNEGISGGDFFISAIGPGMEEYSRYQQVETYSGETVGVDTLLAYIRQIATNFLVQRLLKSSGAAHIDREAQFYLTYRWTYLNNKVPYDDARKIASAEGVNLEQLWAKDGFVRKSGATIEVLGPDKRGALREIHNMVDACHRACQLWEADKKDEITQLITNTGYAQQGSFWQFCQAVAECLLDGTKEKQLLEGLLISKDSYIRDSGQIIDSREQIAQARFEI